MRRRNMTAARVATHRTLSDIQTRHAALSAGPRTNLVAMIVQRGANNARTCPLFGELTLERGLVGDRFHGSGRTLDAQISLIDIRVTGALAERHDWPLAGDNLVVDFELSMANLKAGQTLHVGDAVLEITAEPHLGCKKFAARFGPDALHFVNDKQVRELRRRGVHARVAKPGMVRLHAPIARI
jgi:MOSC domain-containing protein YiiM